MAPYIPLPTLDRRSVLAGGLVGLLAPGLASPRPGLPTRRRRLVVVHVEGGWDPSYTLDPKLDSAAVEGPEIDARGVGRDVDEVHTFADIPLVVNRSRRPTTRGFFHRWAERCVVVNGLAVGSVAHVAARRRVFTGSLERGAPELPILAGQALGADLPVIAFDVSGTQGTDAASAAGLARVGSGDQLPHLLRPETHPVPGTAVVTYPQWVPESGDEQRIRAFLTERAAGLRDRWGDGAANNARVDAFLEAEARASALAEVGAGVDLAQHNAFTQQCTQAVDLLVRGVTASVSLISLGFDTHSTNRLQSKRHEALFDGLSTLVDELDQLGLLDTTLVVVLSELGRAPLLNSQRGKDHYPYTSALLIGGGLAGGRVVGATDDALAALPLDLASGEPWSGGVPCQPANLLAGVLSILDVDPGQWFPGVVPLGGLT